MAQSSDGRFAFADVDTTATGGPNNYTLNVTPGTWSVNARSDGYESSAQNVTVTAGSQTANFALSAISGYTRYDPASSTVTPSRGGLVRVREFTMKDSYSFDVDASGLDVQFEAHRGAYTEIFRRLAELEGVRIAA